MIGRSEARQWVVPAGAVMAMAAVEGCYFLDDASPVKRMAGVAWIAISVGFFAMAAILAARPFLSPAFWRSSGRWWYVLAATLPLALVYFGLNGTTWTPLEPEGTAQAVIGADLLRHDSSLGIFKAAYFGRYVARQYVLSSLPTLAFGPSFAALRVGNSLSYVLSYLVFRFFVISRGSPREVMKRVYAARNRQACAEFFPEFARVEGAVAGGGGDAEGGGEERGDRGGVA